MPKTKSEDERLEALNKELDKLYSNVRSKDAFYKNDNIKSFDPKKKFKPLEKIKKALWPHKCFLINMELRNGDHRTFLISVIQGDFSYLGSRYIIDQSLKYYSIDAKMWCLDYHQDYALPVKRIIRVEEIRKVISETGVIEAELATNPSLIDIFVDSKIAEGVMKGQAMNAFFQQMKMVLVAMLCISSIHFLIYLFKSGALNSIGSSIGIG